MLCHAWTGFTTCCFDTSFITEEENEVIVQHKSTCKKQALSILMRLRLRVVYVCEHTSLHEGWHAELWPNRVLDPTPKRDGFGLVHKGKITGRVEQGGEGSHRATTNKRRVFLILLVFSYCDAVHDS
jgi:hypothetical protein